MNITIHWFRRDLRLDDNTALLAALQSQALIPLFILDEVLLNSSRSGAPRRAFMFECLARLDESLRTHGSRLMIRRGEALAVLQGLIQETGATRLTYNRDYSPYAQKRDERVRDSLLRAGIKVETYSDLVLNEFQEVLNDQGLPFQIFGHYQRRWNQTPKRLPQVFTPPLPPLPLDLPSDPLPQESQPLPQPITQAGEAAAQASLGRFVENHLADYHTGRERLDQAGTSALSPHLRWGSLSIRRAYAAAQALPSSGAGIWISELAWRDFYQTILAYHPRVLRGSYRPAYDAIPWPNHPDWFAAWCAGRTGYPVVDAAMRQLLATGWMHNRARMIVASFLCKDLLIDWRWGEQFFMQNLLDGDTAANNGGWQWTAGTGTDAAPYFRIFNPLAQGQKFDPEGRYIRQWLPELAAVPAAYIHAPYTMPDKNRPALDYPPPIVDHATQRKAALELYKYAKA
jgi:deoxyribodipyrimidine photo-lyase